MISRDFTLADQWLVPPEAEWAGSGSAPSGHWFVYRAALRAGDFLDGCLCHIAVESKYWLYINGESVLKEGGLKRGPVPDGSYYDSIEIGSFLKPGLNTIAVLVWYFGRHGFAHRDSGMPGLLMSVSCGDLSGWKIKRHPAYFDAGYVRDGYRLAESSVGFDARHAHEEWFSEEFDDSVWRDPVPAGPAGTEPWGELEARPVPQWNWGPIAEYEQIETRDDGAGYTVFRCRLPHNTLFVPCLQVGQDSWKSACGSAVEILPTLPSNCLKTVYIAGEGEQFFESPAWLAGDEVVYRIPRDISVRRLSYRETAYPAEPLTPFTCDDPMLHRFCRMAQRTLLLTMRDNFMDCPCRERAQWPGDFIIQQAQVPYTLGLEGMMLVRKALRELFRWQRPDGSLYGPVPEGNWKMELPAQMLACVSSYGPWLYFMHSGDLELLREIYPAAKRYVDLWELDERGLVRYRPEKGAEPVKIDGVSCGGWDWLDWGVRIDKEPLLNMWMACALEGVCRIARCMGKLDETADLEARCKSLRHAMDAAFWRPSIEAYASEEWPHDPDDRVQAMAVLSGTADEERHPALCRWLGNVHQASPYMEKYVLEALFEMGAGEEALQRLKMRYQAMLESGKSSLWEFFHEDPEGTFNHSWSGGPATLLAEKVAGVVPVEAGWKRFLFRPDPCGLSRFSVEVATPQGRISASVEQLEDRWTARLSVPEGSAAKVDLGVLGDGQFERESGDWVWETAAAPKTPRLR